MSKFILIVFLIIGSINVSAGRFNVYSKDQLRDFVAKNHSCFLAVAIEDIFHVNSIPNGAIGYSREVLCIADIATGGAGIQAKNGCGISRFNTETNEHLPVFSPAELRNPELKDPFKRQISSGCAKSWKQVLREKPGMDQGKDVSELLTKNQDLYRGQELLLAEDAEAARWFADAKLIERTSKVYEPPVGYSNVKWGLRPKQVDGYLMCNRTKHAIVDKSLPKDVQVFPCGQIDFEGRQIDGEVYFFKNKFARIMLGVGMEQGAALPDFKAYIKNYVQKLTNQYGPLQTPVSDADLDALYSGKRESLIAAWLDRRVLLSLYKVKTEFGMQILLSGKEYPSQPGKR